MQETRIFSLGWEDPLEEGVAPAPVFLPGEFHRQRSLLGATKTTEHACDGVENRLVTESHRYVRLQVWRGLL